MKKQLNRANVESEQKRPIKIIQFGEGNFLRAFVDYAVFELNKVSDFNAGVAVVQPIENGLIELLDQQDGLYTLFTKGIKQGREIQDVQLIDTIVKSVNPYKNYDDYLKLAEEETLEFVISNTTEAGIAFVGTDAYDGKPPTSFPAKLTVLLHRRFKHFKGNSDKGLTIIPCELINHNAETLKEIILKYIDIWTLEDEFKEWILQHNSFHSTLVDRIVPGYPKANIESYNQQLDYSDKLIVSAESFFLWVIEGGEDLKSKLPFHLTNLNVKIVEDMQPFRTRKVRILNGAHTSMVPFSILYGNVTVKESVDDAFTGRFIQDAVFNEIIDTLDMEKEELKMFAEEVFDRFRNPFIVHNLSSIALNSISKFKVRVLPSLLKYVEVHDKLPLNLTFAFACLIRFYKGDWNGKALPVKDEENIVDNLKNIWKSNDYNRVVLNVLGNVEYLGQDLNLVSDLSSTITRILQLIDKEGIELGYQKYIKQ